MKMKNKIYTALVSLALMAGFSACNEKWEPNADTGTDKGKLSTADLAVDLSNAENIIESRASVDLSNFIVSVTDKDGLVVNEWTYATMPGLPVFNVGNYTLKIESGKPAKAAWDVPYFVGTKQFTIVKDEITNAGVVTCTLQNLKVTVNFSDELIAASAGDLKCEIRVNEEGVLRFTADEKRSGYFEVVSGNTTMVATFTGTVMGYNEEIIRLYKDLKAGQHRIINFTLKGSGIELPDENGFIDPTGGLNVDFSVIDENLNANVNTGGEDVIEGNRPGGEEWPDDPDKPDVPDVPNPPVTDAITIEPGNELLDLSEGNRNKVSDFGPAEDGLTPAVVIINAEKGLANLNVTIDSKTLDVSDVGLNPEFDLAHPKDEAETAALTGLGFPVGDSVINSTKVTFDISQFVPLLAMFDGEHKFIIEAVDNDGAKNSITLTFVNE